MDAEEEEQTNLFAGRSRVLEWARVAVMCFESSKGKWHFVQGKHSRQLLKQKKKKKQKWKKKMMVQMKRTWGMRLVCFDLSSPLVCFGWVVTCLSGCESVGSSWVQWKKMVQR